MLHDTIVLEIEGLEKFERLVERLERLRAPHGPATLNNYFTISSNHEPSRIAREVVDEVAAAIRAPQSQKRAPGFYWIRDNADPASSPLVALFTSDGRWFYGHGRDRAVPFSPMVLSGPLEPPR